MNYGSIGPFKVPISGKRPVWDPPFWLTRNIDSSLLGCCPIGDHWKIDMMVCAVSVHSQYSGPSMLAYTYCFE